MISSQAQRNNNFLNKCILLFFVCLTACSPIKDQRKIAPSVKAALTEEIQEMDRRDQWYRWQLMFGEIDSLKVDSLLKLPSQQKLKNIKKKGSSDYTLTQAQYDSLSDLQSHLDNTIQRRILEIYNKYGWPGKQLVGKSSGLIAIMMLHFPDSLKQALYPKLLKEYRKRNIAGADLARMYDKYLLSAGQPLLYGMFDHYDAAKKISLPPLIRDIEVTNKERKKLGLSPLNNYRLVQQ